MITHLLDLPYDHDKLLAEFDACGLDLYRPNKTKGESWFCTQEDWSTKTLSAECEEAERIRTHLENIFEVPVTAKFFKLREGGIVPPHVDHGHRCAINIVLSDDPAPIRYRDGTEETYECALINVAVRHEVLPGPERKMIKFQIGRLFYDEAIRRYSQKIYQY